MNATHRSPEQQQADAKAKAEEAKLAEEGAKVREALGLPLDAPDELVQAAQDELGDPDDEDVPEVESKVLNFLLGPTTAIEYDVDAYIDTPTGREKLVFHFKQIPDSRIYEIEAENTEGSGPFAEIDRPQLNAAKVAEATMYLEDTDGRQVKLSDQEFRGPIPDIKEAIRGRFRYQPGIISQVAGEIDAAAGMMGDRVGRAKRATSQETIAKAVGNS